MICPKRTQILFLVRKSWEEVRLIMKSNRALIQAFNWSRNNFGEIHIFQGLDWAFPSLSHYGSSSYFNSELMYRSNRSFNMPSPGIPREFDTSAVPGRREFDYQSPLGGGEFDPHALGVGNLNSTLDFT